MKVVVLGGGLAGVLSAWYLAADGHEVELVDRADGPATLASRANGGILAVSRAFPWPGPQMASTFLKALVRNDQALRVRLRFDPEFWRWGLAFLANSSAARHAAILEPKVRLVRYSQARLDALVEAEGIDYHRLRNGILYVHRSAAALDKAWERSLSMRQRGLAVLRLDPAQLAAHEPALAAAAPRLAGALHAPGDEAGDSGRLCDALVERMEGRGVRFRFGCTVQGFDFEGDAARAVRTDAGTLRADAFVCALGVLEPGIAGRLGTRLPVYPVKGYSLTLPVVERAAAPAHAGIDEGRLVSWCPQGDTLRVTGGAEFAGHARTHRAADLARLADAMQDLFPGATDAARGAGVACLRPMLPESTPRFGPGRHRNLFFNVGLGHMGWAMAAGAGKITADLVAGRTAEIDLEGLRVADA